MNKIYSDYKRATQDEIGKKKPTEYDFPEDMVFGKLHKMDGWSVADCIRGDYDICEQEPDRDLGKSLRPGFRNICNDETRIFGVPTIRHDIRPPKLLSISNSLNNGNEPDAVASIYPNKYVAHGIEERDFDCILPKEEVLYWNVFHLLIH